MARPYKLGIHDSSIADDAKIGDNKMKYFYLYGSVDKQIPESQTDVPFLSWISPVAGTLSQVKVQNNAVAVTNENAIMLHNLTQTNDMLASSISIGNTEDQTEKSGTLHGTAANLDIAVGDHLLLQVTTDTGDTIDYLSCLIRIELDDAS